MSDPNLYEVKVRLLEALIDQLSTGPWWTALPRFVQRRRAIKVMMEGDAE